MAHPTTTWLLDPVIPGPAALPRLERELYEPAEVIAPPDAVEPAAQYPSGTWLVGTRAEPKEQGGDRFATSDAEAPTVRPGSLHSSRRR